MVLDFMYSFTTEQAFQGHLIVTCLRYFAAYVYVLYTIYSVRHFNAYTTFGAKFQG